MIFQDWELNRFNGFNSRFDRSLPSEPQLLSCRNIDHPHQPSVARFIRTQSFQGPNSDVGIETKQRTKFSCAVYSLRNTTRIPDDGRNDAANTIRIQDWSRWDSICYRQSNLRYRFDSFNFRSRFSRWSHSSRDV